MSQQLSLEQMVASWMADEATGGSPDQVVDLTLAATSRTRPLPRWLAVVRESPMRAQTRTVVGVPTRQLAFVATLVLLAAAVVVGVAALLLRPEPEPDAWPGFRGDAARNGAALNGPTGNPMLTWQFEAGGAVRSNVAVGGDLVLAPSDDGTLHALSIDDGSERWTFTGAKPMLGPFVTDGRVYMADGAGVIRALALNDGTPIWAADPLPGPGDITVVGHRLYVGTRSGDVVALDTATGAEVWRARVSPGAQGVHAPAATEAVVVAATDDHVLVALDPVTGEIRWSAPTGDQLTGTPVVADGVAYIGSGADPEGATGRLSAHDIATGAERWRVEERLGSPVIVDSVGYSSGPVGTVAAIDLATGGVRWRASFDGNVRAPAVAGGVVYLAVDSERRVVALDRATGQKLWGFDIASANECCIAVARGLILVGTSAGHVYAIGGDGATLTPLPGSTAPGSSTPSPISTGSPTAPPEALDTSVLWAVDSGAQDFVPWGLARAPDGRLWATEGGSDRISIFTGDGDFVESWGTSGSGDGEFDLTRANGDPYGMLRFAPDGSFYVLDAGNRRIQRFDVQRSFIQAWGSFGTGVGQFSDPVGLAVDSNGNVNVLDDIRRVIETYDANGAVLRTIPVFPPEISRGALANGLSIGPNGHFYVTAIKPNQVIELDRDGRMVATYGAPGSGAGAFNEQPFETAFDAAGRLYVTQGPGRGDRPGVLVFDVNGTYLGGFGLVGAGDAELGFPWGIVVADDGVYVSDVGGLEGVGYRSLIRKFEPVRFP